MKTIKHAGHNGLVIVAVAAGSAAAIFAAKLVADGCLYLGSLAF
jgi:hypothetical protein